MDSSRLVLWPTRFYCRLGLARELLAHLTAMTLTLGWTHYREPLRRHDMDRASALLAHCERNLAPQRAMICNFDFYLCCSNEQDVEQRVDWPVIDRACIMELHFKHSFCGYCTIKGCRLWFTITFVACYIHLLLGKSSVMTKQLEIIRQITTYPRWGQHGAHLGPVGRKWAPCWPHDPCYQGCWYHEHSSSHRKQFQPVRTVFKYAQWHRLLRIVYVSIKSRDAA